MKRLGWLWVLLPLLTGAGAAAAASTPVVIDSVKQKQLAHNLWVPGTVISRNHARVAAEVGGRIEWIAEIGDQVEAGAVLAEIDDAIVLLESRGLEAEVKRLVAETDYLRRKLSRIQEMNKKRNTSKEELEKAEMDLQTGRQELARARIALERKHLDQLRSKLTAPFSGMVSERFMQMGEYVHAGDDVLRLVDVVSREVRARVPMSTARYVSAGMQVPVKYREQQIVSPVRVLVPVGDEESHSVEVRVSLEGVNWSPGTPVRVLVPSSDNQISLLVSRDALVLRDERTYVFRVTEDGKAERIQVETGMGEGGLVSVTGSLNPGDKVIIRGAERLKDGQEVKLISDS